MKRHQLIFLCAVFISTASVASIGAKTQQSKIHGTWLNHSFGYQMMLVLRADGTGEFDGEPIRYTMKDNKFTLFIVADAQTLVYDYKLQENSLTISGGDLEGPVTFSRNGTNVERGK